MNASDKIVLHCKASTNQLIDGQTHPAITMGKYFDEYLSIDPDDKFGFQKLDLQKYKWELYLDDECGYYNSGVNTIQKSTCEFTPLYFRFTWSNKFKDYSYKYYKEVNINRSTGAFNIIVDTTEEGKMTWTGECIPSEEPKIKTKF
jgi:hypothetical protein